MGRVVWVEGCELACRVSRSPPLITRSPGPSFARAGDEAHAHRERPSSTGHCIFWDNLLEAPLGASSWTTSELGTQGIPGAGARDNEEKGQMEALSSGPGLPSPTEALFPCRTISTPRSRH